MTTNEFFKWRSVKAWHRKAKENYLVAVKEGRVGGTAVKKEKMDAAMVAGKLENADVGCTGVSKTLVTNTDTGANTHDKNEKENTDNNIVEEDESEEMDHTIDPGPMPKNLYNIGIIENVKEVFFPRSLRKESLIKWAKFVVEKRRQQITQFLKRLNKSSIIILSSFCRIIAHLDQSHFISWKKRFLIFLLVSFALFLFLCFFLLKHKS